MPGEIIKPKKFEIAKNNIQEIAKTLSSTNTIESFRTEGTIISWNEHNITGSEANKNLILPLNKILIEYNNLFVSLINIANEQYAVLDSLDNEYITGIISAVYSAEEASKQAKTASRQALDASGKATMAQDNIKKTINALTETVKVLKTFKVKVSEDVSNLNNQITSLNNQILLVNQQFKSTDDRLDKIETNLFSVSKSYKEIKESITIMKEANIAEHTKCKKQIMITYYILGGAIGLFIFNFLQLLGIL